MDRYKFKEFIAEIKKLHEFENELYRLHDKYYLNDPDYITLEDELINALEIIFNCENSGWIGYFIYDLEFGEDYEPGCAVHTDGSNIDLSTVDKLYDYLIKNKEEN